MLESYGVPPEHREALIHQKLPFLVTTAVTGINEIREKKGKDALKGSALYHMLKFRNPFTSLGKLKMEK